MSCFVFQVYFNRKKDYSVNLMLVTGSEEEILYNSGGAPGSWHDARVYRRSNLPTLLAELAFGYHILGNKELRLNIHI